MTETEKTTASCIAMEAAVELEISHAIGRITTRAVGEVIQRAIDKALAQYKASLDAH